MSGRPALASSPEPPWRLDEVLTDLATFFDNCHGPVADAVNNYFDDLATANWIPILLAHHARALTLALATTETPQ